MFSTVEKNAAITMKEKFVKTLLFFVIIALLQMIIGPRITGDFKQLRQLKKYLKKPTDVLVFGDSSNWYTAKKDTDKRSISRMLRDRLPGCTVRCITHAAYHPEVYAAFCQYIVRQKNLPHIIIIPINLRAFSPEWDKEPHYQFEKEKIILKGRLRIAFYQPLRVLKYKFNTISRKEYFNTPVFNGNKEIGKIKQMHSIKNQFILKYMYPLTPGHRKINALVNIAHLLSRHDMNAVFYFTPIDYRTGERHLPGQSIKQLKENITLIDSLLNDTGHGCHLLNLSLDLKSRYFAWQTTGSINEHLNQEGRQYVAKKLAETLSGLK
jgi:hypothetical protein